MAQAIALNGTKAVKQGAIAAFFARIADDYRTYLSFRAAYNELSALTDRELTDLGLNRADIVTVAREAAYGA